MSEETTPDQKGSEAPQIISEFQAPKGDNPPPATQPATQEQLAEVKKEMSDYERSTVRWMKVTAVIYAVTAFFILLQWKTMGETLSEMKTSGATATHQLWDAIGNMNWMARTADGSLHQAQQALADSEVAQSKQGILMDGQLTTMQSQLETTDRPWIKIIGAVANHPVIFHTTAGIGTHGTDSINLGIKVIIQNVGRSVALDVMPRADVVFVSMVQGARNNPFTYPLAMQKALCSKPNLAGLPINLFPGEDNRDQTGDDHDAPVSGNTFTIPQDPAAAIRIMPYFVGCVDYRIGTSGKIHQSGFIYAVQQSVPDQQINRGMLIVGNDIAMLDLRFERFVFGGFYAN